MINDLYPSRAILLVDDEAEALMGCEFLLESAGITNTISCQDSRTVMQTVQDKDIGMVLLDLSMPYVTGEELLPQLVEHHPDVPIIIITGLNKMETAIQCMQAGAFDYLVKPIEETRLISSVKRGIELGEIKQEYSAFRNRILTDKLEMPEVFAALVTANNTMHALFHYMVTIGKTQRPVLITGETGTGKELAAQAIHDLSERSGAFVAVNIAGLDDAVFSDTLFGHIRGAFTGADAHRAGFIEKAAGGTLFLDEIGDMPMQSQIKLLRLLQEQEYFPVGADAAKPLEARIVAATNQDLQTLQAEGRFRTDLYYRLKTHTVHLPALRDRIDDIPLLVNHFLEQAADALNKSVPTVPRELYTLLATYHFPGNIRELEAMVFEAVSHHSAHMLSCQSFREHMHTHRGAEPQRAHMTIPGHAPFTYFAKLPTLAEAPRLLITEAMQRAEGNRSIAANLLGISRSGLSKAIKRYEL